jgi:hypothetical protein
MLVHDNLRAYPATLGELFSNGKRYIVPPFQRDYAWDETQWEELWADVKALYEGKPGDSHFLGPIVLQPGGSGGALNVIDGQQRLLTLSLLALAVIARIEDLTRRGVEPDDNRERARLLRERLVSTRDSVSLTQRPRLILNNGDNPFYATKVVQGRLADSPQRGEGRQPKMQRAWGYFHKAAGRLLGEDATGGALAAFLERIAEGLRFIEIMVEDDETAFVVFETLNARGVALSTADLLKNYLYAKAAKGGTTDLEHARLGWEQILTHVQMEHMSSFLFHTLAGDIEGLREKRVFHEVKRLVPDGASVFSFLERLERSAELYGALDDPNHELWQELTPAGRYAVRVLLWLRVEQVRPLILAAWQRLDMARFSRLLELLVRVSVRGLIAHVNTGDLQRHYHAAARQVSKEGTRSPEKILRVLSPIIPSDEEFQSAFEQLALDPKGPRKHLVRYLLAELERAAGGSVAPDLPELTVEHILPINPGGLFPSFNAEAAKRDVQRLGNLTLLEHRLNKDLGAAAFEVKQRVYEQSKFLMTRAITTPEWTPETLRARQSEMARAAVTVWRIEPTSEGGGDDLTQTSHAVGRGAA